MGWKGSEMDTRKQANITALTNATYDNIVCSMRGTANSLPGPVWPDIPTFIERYRPCKAGIKYLMTKATLLDAVNDCKDIEFLRWTVAKLIEFYAAR